MAILGRPPGTSTSRTMRQREHRGCGGIHVRMARVDRCGDAGGRQRLGLHDLQRPGLSSYRAYHAGNGNHRRPVVGSGLFPSSPAEEATIARWGMVHDDARVARQRAGSRAGVLPLRSSSSCGHSPHEPACCRRSSCLRLATSPGRRGRCSRWVALDQHRSELGPGGRVPRDQRAARRRTRYLCRAPSQALTHRRADRGLLNALSGIAWLPLAVTWFGLGWVSVTFIMFNTIFFLVFYNTLVGVRSVPRIFEHAVRTLGGSRRHIIFQV